VDYKKEFLRLFNNEMSKEEAREFLIHLYENGETPEQIATAAEIMRQKCIKLPVSEDLQNILIDVVGTGGDKSNSFNISSTVALLISSVGSFVAKHGNRSITSRSGSADMLEALGININLTPENQVKMLKEVGFTFMFAVNHHPVMKHIMPIRKSIPHRTIFNILGPLVNPAGVKKYLLGVFSPDFVETIAKALVLMGVERAVVLSSFDGMDEASIEGPTKVLYCKQDFFKGITITADCYGLEGKKENLIGKDAKENAKITRAILSGELKDDKLKAVLFNAGFALFADGRVESLEDGIELAKEAIESKRAIRHLERIIYVSNKLK